MLKLRLEGTPDRVQDAIERLRGTFTILQITGPYPNRDEPNIVRLYLTVEFVKEKAS